MTAEIEQPTVVDIELTFVGGHTTTFTVFPGDDFFNTNESPMMSVKRKSGSVEVYRKQHLLYERSAQRTITEAQLRWEQNPSLRSGKP